VFLVTERPESVHTHTISFGTSFLDDCWYIADIVRNKAAFACFVERGRPYMLKVADDVSRHLRLPRDIVPEVVDEAVIAMLDGVQPPQKSAAGWVRSRMLAAANRVASSYGLRGKYPEHASLSESVHGRGEGDGEREAVEIHELADAILDRIDPSEQHVLIEAFVHERSSSEIADFIGSSKTSVWRAVQAALSSARLVALELAA
jgi:DNA-directed RNA polymerase specialized sigma24 family protein